jgi:hypothetical protein
MAAQGPSNRLGRRFGLPQPSVAVIVTETTSARHVREPFVTLL